MITKPLQPLPHLSQTNLNSEKGNILLEFAVCLPFLLLVFICSIELGRTLNTYSNVTRIVYEGTRYAGQVGDLEVGSSANSSVASQQGHQLIRARVNALLVKYDINPGTLPSDYLTTERVKVSGDRDRVRITLKVPFEAVFPIFKPLLGSLSTDSVGPYLFVD